MDSRHDIVLRNATRWKYRGDIKFTTIGDVLGSYVKTRLKPVKRSSPIVDAWAKIVPEGLDEFCEIKSIQAGVLKVAVSNPSYRFEMEMLKQELINSINNELGGKRNKLRDIKFL